MKSFKLMLVQLTLVHGGSLDVFGEPLLELLMIVEQLWHNKMEQGPELSHRVLDRCASQKKSISCVELKKYFPATRQVILDCLSFIEDHVVPLDFKQACLVFHIIDDQIV